MRRQFKPNHKLGFVKTSLDIDDSVSRWNKDGHIKLTTKVIDSIKIYNASSEKPFSCGRCNTFYIPENLKVSMIRENYSNRTSLKSNFVLGVICENCNDFDRLKNFCSRLDGVDYR